MSDPDTTNANVTSEVARERNKTPKGYYYQIELKQRNRLSSIRILDKHSNTIQRLLGESRDINVIRNAYTEWMNMYEEVLQIHEELQNLFEENDRASDNEWFQKKNIIYTDVKHAVEKWLLDYQSSTPKSGGQHFSEQDDSKSQKSSSSLTSTSPSQLSSAKLKESQKKAELLARKAALNEQYELEQEKLKLKIKEEEFKIKTELNVSDAKTRVLEELERSIAEDQKLEDEIGLPGIQSLPTSSDKPAMTSSFIPQHLNQQTVMTSPFLPSSHLNQQTVMTSSFSPSVSHVNPPMIMTSLPPPLSHITWSTPPGMPLPGNHLHMPLSNIGMTPTGHCPTRPLSTSMSSVQPIPTMTSEPQVIPSHTTQTLSPNASMFIPSETRMSTIPNNSAQEQYSNGNLSGHTFTVTPESTRKDPITDSRAITNYLAKKDLNMARFSKFDDDPATYIAWKNSFRGIVKELQCIKPAEEIDLLINWLGPQSSKQVLSLRTSNSHNPEGGLSRIWARLDQRYGAPELIESSLKAKLANFPRIVPKDYGRLFNILDILSEVQSLKEDPKYTSLLSYYDSSTGVNPVVAKLPAHLQSKWTERATRYKNTHQVPYPPFNYFVSYISDMAMMLNDPSFKYDYQDTNQKHHRQNFQIRKTSLQTSTGECQEISDKGQGGCPIHKNSSHKLNECRQFRQKPINERKNILRENKMCFKCCKYSHTAKECHSEIRCEECGSSNHPTCMHMSNSQEEGRSNSWKVQRAGKGQKSTNGETSQPSTQQGREKCSVKHTSVSDQGVQQPNTHHDRESINTKCTTVCGEFSGRSCAKVILVKIFPDQHPEKTVEAYAILDDQSNQSLASPDLLDALNVSGEEVKYTLSSCSGSYKMCGRRALGCSVQSMDNTYQRQLPALIECYDIPDDRSEIATPEVVKHFNHLKNVPILQYRPDCKISLLLGRDIPDVHQVQKQVTGPRNSPFAQKVGLGWVVVGDVCMGKVHKPSMTEISTRKTSILRNGRETIFKPCQNHLTLKEDTTLDRNDLLFQRTKDDDKVGTSVEDRQFLAIMEKEMFRNEEGNWTAPLPFRVPHNKMPNNRNMAFKRAMILDTSLKRNQTKKEHFVAFMSKVISSGAAEVAPAPTGETWYLPIFGVYHPQKPNQIRGVFDSSATYEGVSLNQCLLSGPNLTNDLLGILLRFRKDQVAFAADIEQMFYSFLVREDHRDFLRFFWYRENNPDLELIEYRMRAHVFGNSPSPAVASYGLKKSVECKEVQPEIKDLVRRNFYVDDALASLPKDEDAISLLGKTQTALKDGGNLRLHKIVSNSPKVISAFPVEDLGKEMKALRLDQDPLPTHRSLGLEWDMDSDNFKFNIDVKTGSTPLSRRSILSKLNSIYDPLGFVAPIAIQGKIIMRDVAKHYNWDEPIEPALAEKWKTFEESVESMKELNVPRMIVPLSLSTTRDSELHVFSDASEKAISAVAYLKVQSEGKQHTGFVIGKAKVAPSHGHTIPRLELCGALLATELAQIVMENIDVDLKTTQYYTDSKVVLGYIHNTTRRFYNYVSNRVERILKRSSPDQWNYVFTKDNPADCGTRGVSQAVELKEKWLKAPRILGDHPRDTSYQRFELVAPEDDKEVRIEVRKTSIRTNFLDDCLGQFSDWRRVVNVITRIKRYVKDFRRRHRKEESVGDTESQTRKEVEKLLLKMHQCEQFPDEMEALQARKQLPPDSTVIRLSPYLDEDGLMRVGGRLGQGCLPLEETNPVIVSNKSNIAKLLVRHYHEKVKHQGRVFTEGSIRSHGFWIVGAKRLISSILYHCVVCRKLRGQAQSQKMADLPPERLTPAPPFTNVGLDAFGPWSVVTRKTRGGSANSKRWAILFTCLGTRAVHIEVVEEMSTSSFINAVRRLIAIRGNVKELRSDRGTNFVGAAHVFKNMNTMEVVNVEDEPLKGYLRNANIVWKFNPPHSSHMGGVWERQIGMARKILDAMFLELNSSARNLTHEVLVTLMAEVGAIMNSRPIAQISTDPECPIILSPTTVLTQKTSEETMFNNTDLDIKDLYREQWKRVKVLSEMFWRKWREGYLQSLQTRRKWNKEERNIKEGDVILLKDKNLPRKEWSVGIVVNPIKSKSDNKVRKAEVRVRKEGTDVIYVRPVTELVLLVEN